MNLKICTHTHTSHHITVSCAWETNVHTKLPTEILQVLHKHVVLPSVDLLVLMLLLLLLMLVMLLLLLLLRLLLLLLLWLLLLSPLSPGSGAGGPGAGAGAGVVFLFLFPLRWLVYASLNSCWDMAEAGSCIGLNLMSTPTH